MIEVVGSGWVGVEAVMWLKLMRGWVLRYRFVVFACDLVVER